jgi:geranylgeranyl reductase family protein
VQTCDVLIVGGGPAGSTCARHLARSGLDVVVIDKAEFPRDKVCAGWVTPPVLETLGLDVEDYRKGRVLQDITRFRTGVIGGESNTTRYEHSVSFGIRRCEFDDYLLKRCGAHLRVGEAVTTIERAAEGWVVNGTLGARMLVGAGGHFCPVARLLGSQVGRAESTVTAQEIEFELGGHGPDDVEAGQPELYFCRDLDGYGWCFRKGNFLNVGLGRENGHGMADSVREFWRWLEARGKVPAGMTPPRMKGHAYVLYGHASRPRVADRVVAIGDAAGLAYAQSGEGIRTAVESGVLAARAIVGARGDYSSTALSRYHAAVERRFGRIAKAASNAPPPGGLRAAAGRWLLSQPWFVRRVVLDRWFLHAYVPALDVHGAG